METFIRRIAVAGISICMLSLWMCCSLGCTTQITSARFDSGKYTAQFCQYAGYAALEADLQTDYGELYTAVTDTQTKQSAVTVRFSHPLSSRETLMRLYTAFLNDNPQFFFLKRQYRADGYQTGTQTQYREITLPYTLSVAQRERAIKEMESKTAAILNTVRDTADEFEKERLLHDWLADICTYATDPTDELAYTAYGALVQGQAVCEGYARAMQWLLYQSGIKCRLISGRDRAHEDHMWNIVTIRGDDYHLDVTWDDQADDGRHNYFNLTTAETALTHQMDESGEGCTASEDNYYRRLGLYIDTYSRHRLADVIAREVHKGQTMVELRCGEDQYAFVVRLLQGGDDFWETVAAKIGRPMWSFSLQGEPTEGILRLCQTVAATAEK